MLSPGQILDQAHYEAVLLGSRNHHRGDLGLAESDERLESALTAHEVVSRLALPLGHRDRLLESKTLNARHKLAEDALVARSGIEHGDLINRNHSDVSSRNGHAV